MDMDTDMVMDSIKTKESKRLFTFRLLFVFLLLNILTLQAQQRRVSAYIFKPEWYAGVHVGVNMLAVEGFPNYNWLQSTGISARPLIGYQFSPVIGIRGLISVQGHRWNDVRLGNNDSILSLGSQTVQADLMVNVSNMLFGYSLNVPFDFSLFGGFGGIHRNSILPDNGYFSYLVRGGAQIDYRINQALELNMIAELNITGDNLNAFAVSTPVDLYPALMVGLTWHFRTKRPFSRRCCD